MTQETATETKSKKLVLPKEVRLMMVSSLESDGQLDADGLKDEEILKRYNDYMLKLQDKVSQLQAGTEARSLNMYMAQNTNMKIKDKDFIYRLFNLNVPPYYLHLFRDEQKDLADKEIWQIINKSGINPVKEVAELTKMRRSPVKPKIM